MDLDATLPSLKTVKFTRVGEKNYIEYTNLVSFIESQKQENEPQLQKSNFLKELKNHKDGIKEFQGKRLITVSSFVRYISKHYEQYSVCRQIISELTELLFNKEETNKSDKFSTFELYKQIAKFKSTLWCSEILCSVTIPESRTLYKVYKDEFCENEWNKICMFEYHFSQDVTSILDYEEELSRKQTYLQNLLQVNSIASTTRKKCEETIQSNQCRKYAAESLHNVNFINEEILHSYNEIDRTIISSTAEFCDVNIQCVTVSCSKEQSTHSQDICVFLENESDEIIQEFGDIIECDIARMHNLSLNCIVYTQKGSFNDYMCKQCDNVHRFQLYDDFISKQLSDKIIFIRKGQGNDYLETGQVIISKDGSKLCRVCFATHESWLNDSLDWRCLDISKEWLLHVPLNIQEFFTTCFLNKDSVRRSDNKLQFLLSKLCKLYQLFDTGLSIYNRKYSGIIQQLNSELLVVNYHSVTSVFEITSNSGCTMSFKAAEKWLKNAADADRSYYNTYLKKFPLVYQTASDDQPSTQYKSIRDCFVVLFMDNLVRLSVHEDPDPGKSRTSQLCTLPITLKGLPRDHTIIESWHSEDCLEKSQSMSCECMERKVSHNTAELLITKTDDESQCWDMFAVQLTWSIVSFDEVSDIFSELQEETYDNTLTTISISHEMECLDSSMQSISLEEKTEFENLTSLDDLEKELERSLHLDSTVEEDQFIKDINNLESKQFVRTSVSPVLSIPDTPANITEIKIKNSMECTADATKNPCTYLLKEFKVPPLLCRHPIPATGKDDDIANLKEILDETLQRLNRADGQKDRILFAPDHKISKNLLKLMKTNSKYFQFLPEFPALHLRKSKIVNLFSAYKNAGLLHMLKYMKDAEQEDDWMKLITMQNIETATRNIGRLSAALHLGILMKFHLTLNWEQKRDLLDDLRARDIGKLQQQWGNKVALFIQSGTSANATFALHVDFMKHCDEIIAIAAGERIGGKDGYNLLLSSVKSSLPFAFLNGASSYAAFCVDLLHEHYTAGTFHQNLKMTLFSTPHKDGHVNIALDTQREMDHRDAIKGFRPRSTLSSAVPRMTVVDHFTDARKARDLIVNNKAEKDDESVIEHSTPSEREELLQVGLTQRDWRHIIPVCKLLARVDAFCTEETFIPQNLYNTEKTNLPCEILDNQSYDIGRYLIKKYAASQNLFDLTETDLPNDKNMSGPTLLIRKAKSGKSITMRRIPSRPTHKINPVIDKGENKRLSDVKKKSKVIDCMSSKMNTCQSLVNPDRTKPTVPKASGIKKALLIALGSIYTDAKTTELEDHLMKVHLLFEGTEKIPISVIESIKYATIEFAGIKFKTKATSGTQYLNHIENGILKHILFLFPNLSSVVICEEKYSFTPDDFKSQTRQKRQKSECASIAHLKYGEDILSDHKMSKSAMVCTSEGKRVISNYLARNISKLGIKKDLTLIVDSELIMSECSCSENCNCPPYVKPVQAQFSRDGSCQQSVMTNVKQRKGEAELAQVDWLFTIAEKLASNDSVVSILTSGDIDSLVVHLFALTLHWPRNPDRTFCNTVYIYLQKNKPELYNITGIIEQLENHFEFRNVAINIALVCCMGGNDFIPKMNGISHAKWMTAFLQNTEALKNILQFEETSPGTPPRHAQVDISTYKDIVKQLYCPQSLNPDELTMEEVRQLSIKIPGKDFRHPILWMPPESALEGLVRLLNCQVEYLLTVGDHSALLPDFLGRGCLSKDERGLISYNFGPSCKTENAEDLLTVDENMLNAKICKYKKNKRRIQDLTPEKLQSRKRRPLMSTPIKMKGKNEPSTVPQ